MDGITKTLVIGAHGRIGQILCRILAETDNHEPTAFIRKENQKGVFKEMKVPTVMGNLEDSVGTLARHFSGFDCIVFTAGSGGSTGTDKTISVDLEGAVRTMHAAEVARISRYIMVSASHTDDREYWDKVESKKPYYIAKHFADKALRSSSLNYTILRPVQLVDESASGKITASHNPDDVGNEIPRADVACVIKEIIEMPSTMYHTIELSKGDFKIRQALQIVTGFEGFVVGSECVQPKYK